VARTNGTHGKRGAERRTNAGGRGAPGKILRGSLHLPENGVFSHLGRLILDKLDRGVFVIDINSKLLDANTLALDLLKGGNGITLRKGLFRFTSPALNTRLSNLLDVRRESLVAKPAPFVASVRTTRNGSYRVVVYPASAETVTRRQVAFVVLTYPLDGQRDISAEVLQELYGLTPAQADVARHLFLGETVESTADTLGVSPNTVRSHLKQVFTKCEVQSQAELLHLLAAGPQKL
jgi:DNA-binding CsgD family transcriptional regulator